ncbi:hypothetical protein [Gemmata sp.]|uniref:hypothetical protein n=1 Tax=Gemmata sp. TaxID=1914242 RepID=UPI003F717F90
MDALFDNSPDALTRLEAAARRVEETRAAMERAAREAAVWDAVYDAVVRRRSKGERAVGSAGGA